MGVNIEVSNGNFHYKGKKNASFLYNADINFSLAKGEILAILGPNGAGKTTLLKCITGLHTWKKGETKIDGKSLHTIDSRNLWKEIGYVPQAGKMVFGFSVEEVVVMGRAPFISTISKPKKEDYDRAHVALREVGIEHLAKKSCNEISGGELQLVLIARTLVSEPKVLILDEPESHLDVQKQVTILETIKRLSKEHHISCIINTHYPNHAFYLADQVLMIAKGKDPLNGTVQEVMTEKRMQEYFDIDLKKIIYNMDQLQFETMVPTALAMKHNS